MAVWSRATLSSIMQYDRFDGEYFLPAYVVNENALDRITTISLPLAFLVSDGNHLSVSKHFSEHADIPYFRGQDINEFFLENATPVRIPKKVFESPMITRSHFLSGDVLLSIVGTIGSLSIVPESLGPATGSCKIAILRTKGDYSPFILAAFLLSTFGQLQIRRNTRGAVQMGLILRDLVRIQIPIFPEAARLEIERLVKAAIKSNRESESSYTQAQELLASELGLDKKHFNKSVGYTVRFSELELSLRADPEYFDPVAASVVKKITEFDHVKLDSSFFVKNGFPWHSKKFLSDNSGEPVVRIRNIRPTHIDIEELTSIEPKYAKKVGFPKADKGDVVVGMDGLKYFYASILESECYVNQRVAHLIPKVGAKISPEYATFIINSRVGQAQLLRDMTVATTVGHVTNRDIAKLVIPYISAAFHKNITELIRESIDKKKESKQLIEQAKSRVEQLIEEEAVQA